MSLVSPIYALYWHKEAKVAVFFSNVINIIVYLMGLPVCP